MNEVDIWVGPGAPVDSLFAHAHRQEGDIKGPQCKTTHDSEDGFDGFARESWKSSTARQRWT
ncbi:hypothetical protein E8E12_006437 [Didymella heteroderae]|uniref:Uncharacterized protein n=1 Tax=Didymella heteroderae TaxID=1769908 RepID=A0A9P4WLY7_9PLEO|nr:hypothetical protein E8E12_006437 [Didymella heteroderae]